MTSTTDATSPAAPGTTGVTAGDRPSGTGDGSGDSDATRGRPSGTGDGSDGAGPAAPGVDPHDGLDDAGRRRLRRAWWRGAVPTLAAYLWVLTVGRADLLQVHYFDDFYDAQARSLMHGRLDVPPEVPGFEGFLIDGRTYIYFGPFPSLLRMPVLAVTDRFDGRLTTLSMLLAAVVLAAASFRLLCSLRPLARGHPAAGATRAPGDGARRGGGPGGAPVLPGVPGRRVPRGDDVGHRARPWPRSTPCCAGNARRPPAG